MVDSDVQLKRCGREIAKQVESICICQGLRSWPRTPLSLASVLRFEMSGECHNEPMPAHRQNIDGGMLSSAG